MLIGGRAHSVTEAELIAKAGFPFAEISIRDLAEFQTEIKALKQLKETRGIFYLAHGPEEDNPWEPETLRSRFLPLIKSLLDCAAELSIALFTVHFWIDRRFIDEGIVAEKIKILSDMSCYAADHGINLCIENLSEKCSDFSSAFDGIDSLGMTLDIGHGELLTARNTAHAFAAHCFGRIRHLHLHDNQGGDTPTDDLHLPLGEGVIDFATILRTLRDKGYERTMTLEVQPQFLRNGKRIIEKIWYQKASAAKGTAL